MASFELAYPHLKFNEGGRSNHRSDIGGDTFMGVAKKFHPEMWKNGQPPTPGMVKEFWRVRWNRLQLDKIESQMVANEIFDTACNIDEPGGFDHSVKFAQQAYNHFLYRRAESKPSTQNPQGVTASWPGIAEDGVMGPVTIAALNRFARHKPEYELALVIKMNFLQGAYYDGKADRRTASKEFLVGWYAKRCRVLTAKIEVCKTEAGN